MAAKLILASCALLLALIAVNAEVTCGPTQWEAVRFSKPGRSLSVVNVAVDYKAKKEAFHESIYVNENVTLKYSTFRDWNKTYEWSVDHQRKHCRIYRLPSFSTFQNFCKNDYTDTVTVHMPDGLKPDDADTKLLQSYDLGGQKAEIYQTSKGRRSALVTVWAKDLTPISELSDGSEMVQYGDVTVGIKDPSVFDLPDFCPTQITVVLHHFFFNRK